jgi:hypothetical protein
MMERTIPARQHTDASKNQGFAICLNPMGKQKTAFERDVPEFVPGLNGATERLSVLRSGRRWAWDV